MGGSTCTGRQCILNGKHRIVGATLITRRSDVDRCLYLYKLAHPDPGWPDPEIAELEEIVLWDATQTSVQDDLLLRHSCLHGPRCEANS